MTDGAAAVLQLPGGTMASILVTGVPWEPSSSSSPGPGCG